MTIEELKDLGLTDEQMAGVEKFNKGLLDNRDALLGENIKHKESAAEQAKIAEDARQAAVKAQEDKLKADQDMDGLKSHYEQQLAEHVAASNKLAEDAKNALLQRDKGSVLSKLKGLIHEDYQELAEASLSNMLNISYNDQQQAVTTFEHNGQVVANNIDEFKSWAGEQESFKHILKGVNSSGAGTMKTGGASGKPMTLTEKAIAMNKNPNAQF